MNISVLIEEWQNGVTPETELCFRDSYGREICSRNLDPAEQDCGLEEAKGCLLFARWSKNLTNLLFAQLTVRLMKRSSKP